MSKVKQDISTQLVVHKSGGFGILKRFTCFQNAVACGSLDVNNDDEYFSQLPNSCTIEKFIITRGNADEIGTKLLDALFVYCKKNDFESIIAKLDNTTPAIQNICKKFGFEQISDNDESLIYYLDV